MARFSGQIHSAKFIDVEEKVIEVLYGESTDSLTTFNVPVDYTNNTFTELLQEVTIEEVQDQTKAYFNSVTEFRDQQIHSLAEMMFKEWVSNAQEELDRQDKARYKIFEEYKNQWLEVRYKEADQYKEQQLEVLQKDIDDQVEARYAEVNDYKESQLAIIETEVNKNAEDYIAVEVEKRFAEVDAYKQEQLLVLQAELDLQVQGRFEEADKYKQEQLQILQAEVNKNAEDYIAVEVEKRYTEVEAYKQEQLKTLQAEVDSQVEERYAQVENYKEQEADKIKADLKSRLKVPTPTPTRISTDNVLSYLFDRIDDEDTVFKAKLAIFDKAEVKNHKDRELKMKVRKAKTIPELFAAYNECLI